MSTATVTYNTPSEDDSPVVTIGGVRFFDGQAQKLDTVEHGILLAKLRTNQHFTVSEPKADKPKAEKTAEDGLKAVHNGGGRFVIKNGADTVKDGLTKEDAAVFNALSDADKAEYVKA
jgi:hypothetical protein